MTAPLAAMLLAGCGLMPWSGPPTIDTREVSFRVASDVNGDHPVETDIVYVLDPKLTDTLLATDARQWFSGKEKVLRDFPKGALVRHWEFAQGSRPVDQRVEGQESSAVAAFLFANYASPGSHRARLDPFERPVVKMLAADFLIDDETDAP